MVHTLRQRTVCSLLVLAVACGSGAVAAVRLPAVFADHMVLQRDLPLPVWGWAEPGEKVTVTLNGKSAVATAGPDGRWQVKLEAQPAGGPAELTVAGTNTLKLTDILFGDVWVCSGQSNMQFGVGGSINAAQEIAGASFPKIRLFGVPLKTALTPAADCDGTWQICTPQTVPGFTAVGFFFGRELHRALDVPIGLIGTSWGGTIADAWTPLPAFAAEPTLAPLVAKFKELSENYPQLKEKYPKALAQWQAASAAKDTGNKGLADEWATTDFDDTAWTTVKLPALWKTANLGDGVVWCRQTIEVPEGWDGQDLQLALDTIDTFDTTYFNGTQVGETGKDKQGAAGIARQYTIPGKLVKTGPAALAVRVVSASGNGGFTGKPKALRLACAGAPGNIVISLAGPWKCQVEQKFSGPSLVAPVAPVAPEGPNHPCVLYNAMISPLVPFGIKGAIWYQGESNAGRAFQYRTLLPTMIKGWHTAWGQGPFPFLIVQLANFTATRPEPADSDWAELREAQSMTAATVPNAGIAVAIDIGDAADIHPKNKQEVGRRLALVALAQTYGQKIECGGPTYESMKVEGGKIRLAFKHVGGGLVTTEGAALKGFAIAGTDHKFVWADATIDGATVVVSAAAVPEPVAVRYAWAHNPVCNLYNKDGLPASPFRTDDWPGVTAKAR